VPRLCELYPGICLTTEGTSRKTSARVVSRATQADSAQKKNKYNKRTEYNTITKYNTITCTIQEHEQYYTQKKNSNK
jgi:hypothetical protein